ncbi:MAG: VIT1/CCC1 transporter family protein [Acidobacteria bacterium]|nr:VIT1/CCC1 transporter family protein [Acidobacteriota bacterium]MBV9147581.1 VIT1/CCC1 transporter family protein [Acidobacteriota bacterium]MBV9435349.1 VIT1/CCC1 transporter family protein [Acidobacteriota bacterium]
MAHQHADVLHVERHFASGDLVRDVVIGMSDGLTVPFALAAGLTGAVSMTKLIVLAGLAEIAAGSIAMGLGGYLAAKGDAQHYDSERKREEREIVERVHDEEQEIYDIFHTYGVSEEESTPVLNALKRNPTAWVDFMMRFELGLERPEPERARNSAGTIAASYIVGGFIPLAPYMAMHDAYSALTWSVIITIMALAVFGFIKGRVAGISPVRSALQTTFTGGLAAAAAFALARLFSVK